MIHRQFLIFAALFLGLRYPSEVLGWSGPGHQVVAGIAYRQLSSQAREKVIQILKFHPDYEAWEQSFPRDGLGLEFGAYVFLQASTWPDDIRRSGNEYDHPAWHYIDYPLQAPDFPLLPRSSPTNDILFAIEKCERAVTNTQSNARLRAVYLSYLAHLVGDIHQPLHCGSLHNATFPMGDKGGNDFYIKPARKGIKLHGFWDGLLGTSGKAHTQMAYGVRLQSTIRRKILRELKKSKTPSDWSLESRAKAAETVYQRGLLKGSTSSEGAPELPADYISAAKALAERQAVLAGYRLADEIDRLLK